LSKIPVVKSIVYGTPIQKFTIIIVILVLNTLSEAAKKETGCSKIPRLTSKVLKGPSSPKIFLMASKETN
jgi:hypothetical protein